MVIILIVHYLFRHIKNSDLDNLSNYNNNDAVISYILSFLVLTKKTNHILLPILNIDVKIQQFQDIIKDFKEFEHFKKKLNDNAISDIFSIKVRESFFKMYTLCDYLKSNQCDIKILLFQLIHTLALLQNEYPNFRHNKLDCNNIFVYTKKVTKVYDKYLFNNKEYYLPKNKLNIKIGNFNHSKIPGYYDNSSKIPFNNKNNNYFDLHYFLNTLLDNIDISPCDDKTKQFIDKIIPEKYRNKTNNNYIETNDELFTPAQLIDDDYFNEYFTKPNVSSMEVMSNEDEYVYGRRSLKHSKNKDKRMKKQRRVRRSEMVGGAINEFKFKQKQNNPFITNEERIIHNLSKPENPVKPQNPKDDIIAQKTIRRNPNYVPDRKLKENIHGVMTTMDHYLKNIMYQREL